MQHAVLLVAVGHVMWVHTCRRACHNNQLAGSGKLALSRACHIMEACMHSLTHKIPRVQCYGATTRLSSAVRTWDKPLESLLDISESENPRSCSPFVDSYQQSRSADFRGVGHNAGSSPAEVQFENSSRHVLGTVCGQRDQPNTCFRHPGSPEPAAPCAAHMVICVLSID